MTEGQRKTVISIGSNLGDRLRHLADALAELGRVEGLTLDTASSVYETKPWGPVEQGDFLNLVVVGSTSLAPEELLEACLAIEAAHGRERSVRWGPRTLDLDIVMVGDEFRETEELTLPHPRAKDRAFVAVPWLEADPVGALPGWGPLRELVDTLDASEVERRDDLTEQLAVLR